MAFRFPLATVLRLREIAEEREERALGQILQQITQCRQLLDDLAEQRGSVIEQRETQLKRSLPGSVLHISYGHVRALDDAQAQANERLSQLEIMRHDQMKVYEAAHRERELLSGMKQEQLQDHRREQMRQEQMTMDDNFNARRLAQ